MHQSSNELTVNNHRAISTTFSLFVSSAQHLRKAFRHNEVWLEPVPHWFVPFCPRSEIGERLEGL
jgi:hypothetical protein